MKRLGLGIGLVLEDNADFLAYEKSLLFDTRSAAKFKLLNFPGIKVWLRSKACLAKFYFRQEQEQTVPPTANWSLLNGHFALPLLSQPETTSMKLGRESESKNYPETKSPNPFHFHWSCSLVLFRLGQGHRKWEHGWTALEENCGMWMWNWTVRILMKIPGCSLGKIEPIKLENPEIWSGNWRRRENWDNWKVIAFPNKWQVI